MKLQDVVKMSNKDVLTPEMIENLKVKYFQKIQEFDEVVKEVRKKLSDKFNNDLAMIFKSKEEFEYLEDGKKLRVRIGQGNIYLNMESKTPQLDNLSVVKNVVIERNNKKDVFQIVLTTTNISENIPVVDRRNVEAFSSPMGLTIERKNDIVKEVESITNCLAQLDMALNSTYHVGRSNEKPSGKANQSDNLESMIERLFDISELFR